MSQCAKHQNGTCLYLWKTLGEWGSALGSSRDFTHNTAVENRCSDIHNIYLGRWLGQIELLQGLCHIGLTDWALWYKESGDWMEHLTWLTNFFQWINQAPTSSRWNIWWQKVPWQALRCRCITYIIFLTSWLYIFRTWLGILILFLHPYSCPYM